MSAHPIFQRMFADMGRLGLLPDNEQRAGETVPEPTPAADPKRRAEAQPVRPWPSHGGCEL